MLPDLRSLPPFNVQVSQINGQWQLGFASEAVNDGPGYLKVTGNGPGNAPMVADQDVQMSDGTETVVPGIGEMHYVIGGGHEHWHILDFERYELRSAADPSTPIVKDQKTGFCLANAFTSDFCGRNHPEYTTVTEGISAGGTDTYLGYLEGQYLILDPTTVPDGDYLLTNRVNPEGNLLETDTTNDASSVRLTINWDASTGTPTIKIVDTCPGTIDCAPPQTPDPQPSPQPSPEPQPQQDPAPLDAAPAPPVPANPPQVVPVVPPTAFKGGGEQASMSRSMAGRLVRRAITKSLRRDPGRLKLTCTRRTRDGFACKAAWRTPDGAQWSGNVRVWYRLHNAELSWFYTLTAQRHPGGRTIVTTAVRGSAARSVFADAHGALFCTLPH